ncbi:MAG: hypothetical protein D6724_03865 [Armatimonadetes bacterium]|nr:MAG: hypothetical protein D6724_03865 [Armatimonadota bacterium]
MLAALALVPLALASADAYGGSVFVDPPTTAVRLTSEAVTFTVGKRSVSVEARYMFKNTTSNELSLLIGIPLVAENTNRAFGSNRFDRLSATWDKESLAFAAAPMAADINPEATSYVKPYVATAVFKPNATHVLRVQLEYPIGKDDLHRFLAWRTAGAASWAGTVERADYSFKFNTDTVFHIIKIEPNWGWQWGTTGAYAKRTNFEPSANETIRFRYYPSDF